MGPPQVSQRNFIGRSSVVRRGSLLDYDVIRHSGNFQIPLGAPRQSRRRQSVVVINVRVNALQVELVAIHSAPSPHFFCRKTADIDRASWHELRRRGNRKPHPATLLFPTSEGSWIVQSIGGNGGWPGVPVGVEGVRDESSTTAARAKSRCPSNIGKALHAPRTRRAASRPIAASLSNRLLHSTCYGPFSSPKGCAPSA